MVDQTGRQTQTCCSVKVVVHLVLLHLLLLLLLRRDSSSSPILSLFSLLLVDLLNSAEFLLELHAPVLEPNLDLPLRQAECVRDLNPPPPRQVVVEVELLLQLQRLEPGVGLPAPPPWTPIWT